MRSTFYRTIYIYYIGVPIYRTVVCRQIGCTRPRVIVIYRPRISRPTTKRNSDRRRIKNQSYETRARHRQRRRLTIVVLFGRYINDAANNGDDGARENRIDKSTAKATVLVRKTYATEPFVTRGRQRRTQFADSVCVRVTWSLPSKYARPRKRI